MADNETIANRLHDILCAQFGDDWRKDITLTLRADLLYWWVFLAERGIEERRQHFKANPSQQRPAEAAASLASWTIDLESLLGKVRAALTAPKKTNKK